MGEARIRKDKWAEGVPAVSVSGLGPRLLDPNFEYLISVQISTWLITNTDSDTDIVFLFLDLSSPFLSSQQ